MNDTTNIAHPPETIEGWYALHQIYRSTTPEEAHAKLSPSETEEPASGRGWTRWVRLIGSPADLMVIHFRPTLDDIAGAQDASRHWIWSNWKMIGATFHRMKRCISPAAMRSIKFGR